MYTYILNFFFFLRYKLTKQVILLVIGTMVGMLLELYADTLGTFYVYLLDCEIIRTILKPSPTIPRISSRLFLESKVFPEVSTRPDSSGVFKSPDGRTEKCFRGRRERGLKGNLNRKPRKLSLKVKEENRVINQKHLLVR